MILDFQPLGDRGIRVGFPPIISPEVNWAIRAFVFAVEREEIPGILEMVPTYAAVSIFYEPGILNYAEMVQELKNVQNLLEGIDLPPARLIEIPVLYGGGAGPDLPFVAGYHQLNETEVVKIHTSRPYLVYMIGFTPGFPYLGGLSERIATPRLANPRTKIPGGSVGIGGSQTGIYSIDAPGGWQIIGHTPVKLYDSAKADPVFLRAGDYLQFFAVEVDEYQTVRELVNRDQYIPQIRQHEGG